MTKREKFLAGLVGLLLLMGALLYALPPDIEKARSLYQTWLLDSVTATGLDEPNVNVISSQVKRGNFHQLSFTVSGRGDLKQLIRFLHDFYSADYLHRIRRLHLKRISGTRQLDLSMAIEALSLPTATHTDGLSEFESGRLDYGDLERYFEVILARNLSGPPNRDPEFPSIGDQRVNTNSTVSFALRARDPDELDRLSYSMEADEVPGAELHPQSGEFRWRPEEPGEYQVVFTVTDDGFPPRSQSHSIRISVSDPPPEEPREPVVEKPSFDMAQFVYVTAITEVSGRRQAWINVRTEGRLLKLFEGEAFDVGQVPVTVKRIDPKSIELEAAVLEKLFRVGLGQNLAQGSDITRPEASG
jgi:hypothetical protein